MTNNPSPTSTVPTASSTGDRTCSVDNILNEMNLSFALCTKSSLYNFYNSACKKGSECSVNWTSNSILMNPLASKNSTSNSSWWSNFDIWRPSSSATTTCPPSTTCTISATTPPYSSPYDLYERIGTLSNQWVTENRIVTSVTQQIEDKLNGFLSHTLKFTTAGVFFGAVAGAAVATGVIVGMMFAAGAMGAAAAGGGTSTTTSHRNPPESFSYYHFLQALRRRLGIPPFPSSSPKDNSATAGEQTDHNNSTMVSTNGPLVILQGNPSSFTSVEAQCISCLEAIAGSLKQQSMTWRDIRRITAYLVTDRCDANTFRRLLQEHCDYGQTPPPPLVTILYVQKLESDKALLQIEAMASK